MRGQFNDTARIISGGTKLEVTGPVWWDSDELGAKIRAQVTQGSVVARGESEYTPSSAGTWSATLTTNGGTLEAGGPEPARAKATVSTNDGKTEPYPWQDQVELVE